MSSLGIYLEPALNREAHRMLSRQKPDIVIGIPSHRNGRTIGEVVGAICQGITMYLSDYSVLLINADGGSSDNTTRVVSETKLPPNTTRLVTTYQDGQGKGRGILAILEAAYLAQAKACAIFEAQAPGIKPEWVQALIEPVLEGSDLTVGAYSQSTFTSSLADNLASPLFRLFGNVVFRQPICTEFCVSDRLTRGLVAQDVWETDIARFGVGAWVSSEAMVSGAEIVQVELGFRGDAHCDPGDLSDMRFMHLASTLFRFLSVHYEIWQQNNPLTTIPVIKGARQLKTDKSYRYIPRLLTAFSQGCEEQGDRWQQILSAGVYEHLIELRDQPTTEFAFPVDLWAQIVTEFAVVFNQGDGDPDRVAESLLPIYYARTAAYIRQLREVTAVSRDDLIEDIASVFGSKKPQLVQLWNSHQLWIDDDTY